MRWGLLLLQLASVLTVAPQERRLSITGRVSLSDGYAIAGAIIRLSDVASKEEWTSKSNSDGFYEIKGFRAGVYQLTVAAAGYEKYFADNLRLVEPSTNRDVILAALANRYFPWPEQAEYYLGAVAKLLPSVGPGLRALVRNATGHYYALVEGKHFIAEYSPNGALVREIPVVITPQSTIVYGVSLSIDQSGRLYVADQGANAVKIFDPNGELLAVVKASAPVSVQGIQEGEIAVQQLGSTHLVTVLDRRGAEMRRYIELPPTSERHNGRLPQHWRFYSDSRGNIYCSLPAAADWVIRKYDLYGVAHYDMSIPSDEFGPESRLEKIVVLLTPSIGLPGMGMMGGTGVPGGTPGVATGGLGAAPLVNASTVSDGLPPVEMSGLPEITPRAATAASSDAGQATGNQPGSPDAVAVLQSPAVKPSEGKPKAPKNNAGEIVVSDDPNSNLSVTLSTAGVGRPAMAAIPAMAGGNAPMGGTAQMTMGGMGMVGPMSSGMPVMMSSAVQWVRGGIGGGGLPGAGGPGVGSAGPGGSGGPPKGGFGLKSTMGLAFDVTIRPGIGGPEIIPDVDAIGVDADTEETWVAIGGKLLHFDREGNRVGTYSLAAAGAAVKPVSLIVERRRILVATDPFGIFVYPRPDIVPMLQIRSGQ